MLFLLTQNKRSAVNLETAQHLSIIERLGIYELVFFRESYQCVVINSFHEEKHAIDFLRELLDYIENRDKEEIKPKIITCDLIYNYMRKKEFPIINA